jgi:hypothetical protein
MRNLALRAAIVTASKVGFTAVNVLLVVIELLGLLVQQPFVKPDYVPYIIFAQGVLNIVLRGFFLEDKDAVDPS